MRDLVPLNKLVFECTIEGGIPIKRLKHAVFEARGEVPIGFTGEVVTSKRELELVESLRGGNLYATVDDKEFHYKGR